MQETNLLKCLETGFKEGIPPRRRQSLVVKIPEWGELDKPWKSLLLIALYEMQVPNEEDENSGPNSNPMRVRRNVRTRRGSRSSGQNHLDWLPSSAETMLDDNYSDAFKLSILLIRKTLFEDEWDDEYNSSIEKIRAEVMEKGVHPVWGKMAEATPILAQFAAFPKNKKAAKVVTSTDISAAYADPKNTKQLAVALKGLSSCISGAANQMSIKRVITQLGGKRGVKDIGTLGELEGQGRVITALLEIHLQQDSSKTLKKLSKDEPEISSALSDYVNLQNGKVTNWEESRSLKQTDGLSLARKKLAWGLAPEEASQLSSAELEEGLSLVETTQQREKLLWWKLEALVNEGSSEQACETLTSLQIESDADLNTLLPLVKKLGEEAFTWLEKQIPKLSLESLSQLIDDKEISTEFRVKAACILHDSKSNIGIKSSIELFTISLDLVRLADILLVDEQRCIDHPYETLLVANLLPASTKKYEFKAIRSSRKAALASVHDVELPSSFSKAARGLILLLDGAASDDDWAYEKLDKTGLKAFNNCRQALREGGDGLADSKVVEDLAKSVEKASLTELESRMFNAVISTLRLNRASWLLQTGQSNGVVELLDGLLSGNITAMPMMQAVRHLVLEYDIGLPNLVSWYQENDPQSPWHILARAAIHVSKGDELNAARDYKRAGSHSDFDYEHRIMLHRKALIHLAHSGQWSEAVNLLQNEPALKAAVTKRFQLYLNVSHSAESMKKTGEATRLLKNFVKVTTMVDGEGQDGERIKVERVRFSEEELDMLRNYPLSHPRPLPTEPFGGRVKAASSSILKERKRNRRTHENRYSQAMMLEPISSEEIYEIARDAAEEKALEGLMILERAQNSGKLSILDVKRLADAEKGLFAIHRHNLPVKQRAYLRNLSLSPLVIVDTNILIDELQYRISEHLDISAEASLDVGGRGRFHRILRHRKDEGRIELWMPKIVQHELRAIGADIGRIKQRFSETLVGSDKLDQVITESELKKIVDQIITDFSSWKPMDLHLESEINNEETRSELKKFLLNHKEVYEEITAMKRLHSEPVRSVIKNKDIYPESPDQDLMCLASILADQPLDELGSILVATKDSDFTLVGRAIEERFGFGVIANSRELNSWLM